MILWIYFKIWYIYIYQIIILIWLALNIIAKFNHHIRKNKLSEAISVLTSGIFISKWISISPVNSSTWIESVMMVDYLR